MTQEQHVEWWKLCARGPWLLPKDGPLLENAVRQTVRVRKLAAMVEKRGFLQRDKDRRGGKMERTAPWARQLQRAETDLDRTLTKLGFHPGSQYGNAPPRDQRGAFEKMLDCPPGDFSGWPTDEEIERDLAKPPNFILPKG